MIVGIDSKARTQAFLGRASNQYPKANKNDIRTKLARRHGYQVRRVFGCRFEAGNTGIRIADNSDRILICGAYFDGTQTDMENHSNSTKVLP